MEPFSVICCFSSTDSVKQKGGCTFVHCVAGISRSATVCIAYLMKHLCWELQRAFDFLKARRSCVAPNLSFMGQLLAFEKQLNPDITTHGIVVKYKEETKYKRSSPTSEEEVDLMTVILQILMKTILVIRANQTIEELLISLVTFLGVH